MNIIDKSDALNRLDGAVIDIGCGSNKRDPGFIGIDLLDAPGVDLVGSIETVLEQIPDDTLSGAYSSHFFEHADDVPSLMNELARTLRSRATLEVVVPHFSNPYFYSDPTHKMAFGLYSFSYLSNDSFYRRQVPTYSRHDEFDIRSALLCFKSTPPFYGRHAMKRAAQTAVNINRWTQEFYEENLVYLLPCYEVRFKLTRR